MECFQGIVFIVSKAMLYLNKNIYLYEKKLQFFQQSSFFPLLEQTSCVIDRKVILLLPSFNEKKIFFSSSSNQQLRWLQRVTHKATTPCPLIRAFGTNNQIFFLFFNLPANFLELKINFIIILLYYFTVRSYKLQKEFKTFAMYLPLF